MGSEEFKKWPRYKISALWVEDSDRAELHDRDKELGLSVGETTNSFLYYFLSKEELTEKKINKRLLALKMSKEKEAKFKGFIRVEILADGQDSWVLEWFCHSTPLIEGKGSDYYIDSFKEFVNRKNTCTLMGADERWRWRGENEGDPAPCRCANCTKQGVVRINH